MSGLSRYKWFIVVEGTTDVKTYEDLLIRYGVNKDDFCLVSAYGKGNVCNTATWDNIHLPDAVPGSLYNLVNHDSGRAEFCGIILLIDSDTDSIDALNAYKRNSLLLYIGQNAPSIENKGDYWFIDTLDGVNQIPIYGINVPTGSSGCLETDLLDSYGFPIEGQTEYTSIVDAIQKASGHWQIPKHGDGKDWWEVNKRAKLDKFIYSAFSYGFHVSGKHPILPNEPNVIQNIKKVIGVM